MIIQVNNMKLFVKEVFKNLFICVCIVTIFQMIYIQLGVRKLEINHSQIMWRYVLCLKSQIFQQNKIKILIEGKTSEYSFKCFCIQMESYSTYVYSKYGTLEFFIRSNFKKNPKLHRVFPYHSSIVSKCGCNNI